MRFPRRRAPRPRSITYPDGLGGSFTVEFCPVCLVNVMEENLQLHLTWHVKNGEDIINEDD